MGRTDKSRGLVRDTFLGKVSAFPYFIYSLNQDYSSFTYYKDIVEAFLMVYEENKDDVALNRNFGYIYYLLGDYDSAMSYLNRSRSLNGSAMDFLNEFLISMILFRTGEIEKSISLLKKITDYFPNNLDVISLLGYLYHRIGRDDVGIKFTNKALSLNSDKPINLHFYLSLNYIGLNKLYKAKQVIEKIKGKNYIPEYYLISSYLSAEFRNFEDSYRYFEKYIKLKGSIDKNSVSDIFAEKSFLRLYNHKAFYKNINELIIKYYSTH